MTTLTVTVTREDIERGRRNAVGCPLARAIRRATRVRPVAVFGGGDGYLCGDKYYPLKQDARLFVGLFDSPGTRAWLPAMTFEILGPQ